MRFSVPATAVSLCLVLPVVVMAVTPAAAQAASVTPAPATAAPATGIRTPEGTASDAAARHAKRTECLKEAKAKKLVGAEKSSFIKDCVAAH
jgi:psiF repeat